MLKLLCVAGARPNFVKIAPLHAAFERHEDLESRIVHTGQHYDRKLSGLFFEQLGLPEPHRHLAVGSGSHAEQTAAVMRAFDPVLSEERPDAVVVVGDVNSTLAAALTATKRHIPVVHVEAGLRSGDRRMPEEINRIATDAVTDLCLTTEPSAREHLLAEGVPEERIAFVGNVMIDTLENSLPRARSAARTVEVGFRAERYVLATLHRPETVDEPARLARALDHLEAVCRLAPTGLPLHPRTLDRLEQFGLEERIRSIPNLHVTGPLGYLEFLGLMADAALVITDSGGIQEETTALGVPCITVRDSTERPVTVTVGTNVLHPLDRDGLADVAARALEGNWKRGRRPDGWDGHAAERAATVIAERLPALARR